MNTVARGEIKWLPACDLLSASLLSDSLNAATLHCRHLRLIPLKAERGLNFAELVRHVLVMAHMF